MLHGYCVRQGWRRIVCTRLDARSRGGRLKQRLNWLRRRFPEAETACVMVTMAACRLRQAVTQTVRLSASKNNSDCKRSPSVC